jgi:hypothetical protein
MSVFNVSNSLSQLTEFIDSNRGETLGEASSVPIVVSDDNSAPLSSWFARPLRTHVFTWSENTDLFYRFNPWFDYFSNPEVYSKLKGFSRLNCTLNVKLVINSSPFMYSLGIMSYHPLSGVNTEVGNYNGVQFCPPFSGGYNHFVALGSAPSLMNASQKLCAFFKPSKSEGCELTLPFIYPNPWIDLKGANLTSLRGLGHITLESFDTLRNSSGTPQLHPITVSIYVWATDVKLVGPSMSLQSSVDEYPEGPISKPASIVSSVAGALSSIPYIGSAMRATSMAASGVGAVAKLFGFSNPPVISPVPAILPKACIGLNTPDISLQIEKIALDSKNELSVSPITIGSTGVDEMTFAKFQDRHTYIGRVMWDPTDSYDTALMAINVTPVQFYTITSAPVSMSAQFLGMQLSPGCLLASQFEYWRGPITFTFKVAASAFHRGRLRLLYDPNGPSSVSPYGLTRLHQKIWDLSESDEMSFEVNYSASGRWLKCGDYPFQGLDTSNNCQNPIMGGSTNNYDTGLHNGYLQLSVLSELTSAAGTSVPIMAFINTSKIEFASPRDVFTTMSSPSFIVPQSDVVNHGEVSDDLGDTIGEKVVSIRTIVKRHVLWDVLQPVPVNGLTDSTMNSTATSASSAPEALMVKWIVPRIPLPRTIASKPTVDIVYQSPDLAFPWTVYTDQSATPNIVAYGSNSYTTPLSLFASCFVGQRGSISWRAFDTISITNATWNYNATIITPERLSWSSLRPTVFGLLTPGTIGDSPKVGMSFGIITSALETAGSTLNEAYWAFSRRKCSQMMRSGGLFGCVMGLNCSQPQCEAILPQYSSINMMPGDSLSYQSFFAGPRTDVRLLNFQEAFGLHHTNRDTFSVIKEYNRANSVSPTLGNASAAGMGECRVFAAAGDDFTLLHFVAVPIIYRPLSNPDSYIPNFL